MNRPSLREEYAAKAPPEGKRRRVYAERHTPQSVRRKVYAVKYTPRSFDNTIDNRLIVFRNSKQLTQFPLRVEKSNGFGHGAQVTCTCKCRRCELTTLLHKYGERSSVLVANTAAATTASTTAAGGGAAVAAEWRCASGRVANRLRDLIL